jgi:hypothetical protein
MRDNTPNHAVFFPGVPASSSNLRGTVPNWLGLASNLPGLLTGKLYASIQRVLSVFNWLKCSEEVFRSWVN